MYLKYLLAFILLFPAHLAAAEISIAVLDNDKNRLSNIVVELIPEKPFIKEPSNSKTATMKQINQQFVPHILVINKGTQVQFPDTDKVLHHVYSFSEAKTFEVAIYKEDIKRHISFDKAGIVELGCNIHDWMLGYLYVANSMLFAQTTSAGQATFSDLPKGNYKVKVWHPRIDSKDIQSEHSINLASGRQSFEIALTQPLLPSYSEFDSVDGLSDYE